MLVASACKNSLAANTLYCADEVFVKAISAKFADTGAPGGDLLSRFVEGEFDELDEMDRGFGRAN